MSEPLYLLTVTEDEVTALSLGQLPEHVVEIAKGLIAPLTRTDHGQTSFVYTEDRLEKEAHG
jgi:hypothetical protein